MTFRLPRPVLFALGASLLALIFSGCETQGRRMAPGSFSTVVIDAGHGGKDSGEHPRGGLYEKEVALDTAERVRDLLDKEGIRTVMTRSSDVFVELDDRVAIANRYGPNAILVSIHYNASPSSAPRGVETFFWRSDSYGLATRVQRHLLGETDLPNHGVTRRVLRLTHNPRVPSILCECGYLTNGTDASLVATETFRQKVAQGIADGVLEQQEQGDNDIGTLPKIRTTTYSATPSRRHYHHHRDSTGRHGRSSGSSRANGSTRRHHGSTATTTTHHRRHHASDASDQ